MHMHEHRALRSSERQLRPPAAGSSVKANVRQSPRPPRATGPGYPAPPAHPPARERMTRTLGPGGGDRGMGHDPALAGDALLGAADGRIVDIVHESIRVAILRGDLVPG